MRKTCKINQDVQKVMWIFKWLSDINRLKIVCFLKESPKCVCDIIELLDLPQNLTSHHLKKLRNEWIVISQKKGLKVTYSLNQKTLSTLKDFLYNLL